MKKHNLIAYFATLLAAAGLCQPAFPAQRKAPLEKPKLLLVIIVDQFRYDYLTRFKKDYTSGIARLLNEGAVFTDARYPQFPTVSAVGHSTVLTGAPPAISGIVGNEWFERDPFIEDKTSCPPATAVIEKAEGNKTIQSVTDESACLVGGGMATGLARPPAASWSAALATS